MDEQLIHVYENNSILKMIRFALHIPSTPLIVVY